MPLAALNKTSVSFDGELRAAKSAEARNSSTDALLAELDMELAQKIDQMRKLADRLATTIKSSHKVQLLNLNKDIRKMKMSDFCITHGGDIDEALQNVNKRAKNEMPPPPPPPSGAQLQRKRRISAAVPNSGCKPARREPSVAPTPVNRPRRAGGSSLAGGKVMMTPGGAGPSQQVPFTPRLMETPRPMTRGEKICSTRGSPLNPINTVKAKAGRGGGGPAVVITLADGTEVNMAEQPPSQNALLQQDSYRTAAVDQLLQLQATVESHLRALQEGGAALQEASDEE